MQSAPGKHPLRSFWLIGGGILLAVGLLTAFFLLSSPRITDQYLLRRAISEWKQAGQPGRGPNYQILEQQAAQGYYADAIATARLFQNAWERDGLIAEIVKIRARNGDIPGAKAMRSEISDRWLREGAIEDIAHAQVACGELPAALQTVAPIGRTNEILHHFASVQIRQGDFDGALETAGKMTSNTAKDVFYEIGSELHQRGEEKRVTELAAHMKDRKLAALFLELVPLTLSEHHIAVGTIQATPCDIAMFDSSGGKFDEAAKLIEKNRCSDVSFAAKNQYASDPAAAEKLLRNYATPEDLRHGLGDFVQEAAGKGDVNSAMRFYSEMWERGDKPTILARDVARAWTIQAGPKIVLDWVQSRHSFDERIWGLIGMAEALGHAVPDHKCS
jgi:hypothetical protein